MKSQDILLLLKLVSLQKQELERGPNHVRKAWPDDWQDWEEPVPAMDELFSSDAEQFRDLAYTTRYLEQETGISKTQVSESLRRCIEVGLAKRDRQYGIPRTNTKSLLEFLMYGLKYVFPAKAGELTRGIGTSFAAPVLEGQLISGGDLIPVWPDAMGNKKGLAVEPLFKSVPKAVRKDPQLYALLALVDAIRLGNPREANLAADKLKLQMTLKP